MLQIKALDQHYGESHTLWEMNLDVPPGACLCLLGRNGVGKTTLLKTVMGLIPSSGGRIVYDGIDMTALKAEKRAELGIGYVPQGREIFPLLTVEENLKTGLRAAPKAFGNKIPEQVFEIFPVLKSMLKRRGGDLSGGQQQQLAIGRALVIDPRLLILDEPTEGIQPNIVNEIGDVIYRLNKSRGKMSADGPTASEPRHEIHEAVARINRELGVTVLLVEQKLPFARKIADRFCIMDRGRAVASGAIEQLNDNLVKRYLTV